MLTATIEDLLSWKPCYSKEQIRELAGVATEFTALDVLRRNDLPVQDRLWVVLRPELIDDHTLRLHLCDCAEHVLPIYERKYPSDDRPRHAIETSRRFVEGHATREQLAAAGDAAWAAARDAAGDVAEAAAGVAAGDAVRAAAWAAARAAAWDAARTTAGDAAWDAAGAAWDAAWDAELAWQLERLITLLTPLERAQRLAEKET